MLLMSFVTSGGSLTDKRQQLNFSRLTHLDGLSQPTVLSMTRDRQGFMWFGTQDGLNRFDGYDFRQFKSVPGDPLTLVDNHVWVLTTDAGGYLWIGTTAGMSRFDPHSETFQRFTYSPDDPGRPLSVTAILEDSDQRLWIGSYGGGLALFDRSLGQFVSYRHDPDDTSSLSSDDINVIFQDSRRRLWIGSGDNYLRTSYRGGLNLFDPGQGRFVRYHRPGVAPGDETVVKRDSVTAITEGDSGSLWLGYADGRIARFEPATGAFELMNLRHGAKAAGKNSRITALHFDEAGWLWIGAGSRGLLLYNTRDGRELRYQHEPGNPESLSDNYVQSLLATGSDVWVGTWGAGINRVNLDSQLFTRLLHNPDDPHSLLGPFGVVVAEDTEGRLWVSSQVEGISRFDIQRGVTRHFTAASILPGKGPVEVNEIYVDHEGRIWLGTLGHGLLRYDEQAGRFSQTIFDHLGPQANYITRILADELNHLWIATRGAGLIYYEPETGATHNYRYNSEDSNSLSHDYLTTLAGESSGNLWIGTYGAGLVYFEPLARRFTRFTPDRRRSGSISHQRITDLLLDSRGQLWVGTKGRGIDRLVRASEGWYFEHLTSKDGLGADAIGGMLEDRQGRVWISTTIGIDRYDPESGRVVNFLPADGTLNRGYFIGAKYAAVDGTLYFGGFSGVSAFQPAGVSREHQPPPPRLTELRLFNRAVAAPFDQQGPLARSIGFSEQLQLEYDQNVFSLGFASQDYGYGLRLRYAYQLQGFDRQWIETSADERIATYTNLAPGNYSFRVRAAMQDGPWSLPSKPLDIRVLPAPWKSSWAYLGYGVAVAAGAGYLVWQRYRRQLAVSRSEQRLKLALWASGDELWDWNLLEGQIVRRNAISQLKLPLVLHARDMADLAQFIHPEEQSQLSAGFDDCLTGRAVNFEADFRVLSLQQDWLWVLLRGQVVQRDADKAAVRFTGTLKNINYLKAVEQELRQLNVDLDQRVRRRTAELEQANQAQAATLNELRATQQYLVESEKIAAMTGVVAGVAHEINTPLGVGITAVTHLAESGEEIRTLVDDNRLTRRRFGEFVEQYLAGCRLALDNLMRTSQSVEEFKQLAIESSSESARQINLKSYLAQIMPSLSVPLIDSEYKISLDCPANVSLCCYPGHLFQVLRGLISNCVEHGFKGRQQGRIDIRVSRTAIAAPKTLVSPKTVELVVSDDGVGMSSAQVERIFEPFYTTGRYGGQSGLGLTVIYNQVTYLLNGQIRCDSEPGKGTRFVLCLPLAASSRQSSPTPQSVPAPDDSR